MDARNGLVVLTHEGYSVVEVFEQLGDGRERLAGYCLHGEYATALIIYSSIPEAREALDDVLKASRLASWRLGLP